MVQNNPLVGRSIDEFDLSDPETFKFIEQNVDLDDPETANYLNKFRPQSAPDTAVEVDSPTRTDINGNERRLLKPDEKIVFGMDASDEAVAEYNKFIEDENKRVANANATGAKMFSEGKSAQEIASYFRSQNMTINDPERLYKYVEERDAGKLKSFPGFASGKTVPKPPETPALVPEEEGRGAGERFSDNVREGSLYGFAGIAGRKIGDWLDQFKAEARAKYPGLSEDVYEIMSDEAITNADLNLREEYARKAAADPAWRPDKKWIDNVLSVERWVPAVAGSVLGSVGPESAIAPGSTAAGRIAAQAAISGGANAAYQGIENLEGIRDGYNPTETLIDAAAGAAFQGLSEIPGAVAKTVRARKVSAPREATPVDALGEAFERSDEISVGNVRAKPKQEVVSKATEQVVEKVNKLTEKWSNAPEIEVHESFRDLPDIDNDALGVTTPEGKVLLNVEAIAREARAAKVSPDEVISAVTFHESLGHHGLTQKFGDELDDMLTNLYEKSSVFQKKVDEWVEKNPSMYGEDVNPLARAAEEVFAEMSEKGQISPTMFERLRAFVRSLGRDMGLDLEFNSNEIKVILGMAHNATVNGKPRDVTGNGYRYSRPQETTPEFKKWFTDSKTVDEEGNPLTLYHGTSVDKDFTSFKVKDRGVWFTEDPESASSYALDNDSKRFVRDDSPGAKPWAMKEVNTSSRVMPAYVNIKNPKVYKGSELRDETYRRGGESYARGEAALFRELKSQGYDGVKIEVEPGKNVWAFFGDASQIKSASGNRGTFDPKSKDMRYMKRRTLGNSEGTPQESQSVGPFRSNRPVSGLLDDAAPEKTPETIEEWIDQADSIKMTTRMAEALASGAEVPQLLSARKFLVESSNRAYDLSQKVSRGLGTARDEYLLQKEMERVVRLSESIDEVVSRAGKILRSQQITVESDRAIVNSIRNMMKYDLSTDEGIKKAADGVVSGVKNKKVKEEIKRFVVNLASLPRSILSSMDFSAPGRQALGLIHKKEWWGNLGPMFRAAMNEDYFNALNAEIRSRPTYKKMEAAGLAMTDQGHNLSKREEMFMSEWANKIPVFGKLIRGSERAYSGFLNKVRADVFDDLLRKAEDLGLSIEENPKLMADIAKVINVASGRGNLGSLEKVAPELASAFFSPRLMAARLQTFNPAYYVSLEPLARKEAMKSGLAVLSAGTSLLYLLKQAGATVEDDPRSSDFGKARFGDTRFDVFGGYSQYVTLFARLYKNQTKDVKGRVKTLGEGFASKDRFDVLTKFLTNKGSPIATFITDYLRGEDAVGEPFEVKKAVVSRMIPMIVGDFLDMYDKYGTAGAVKRVAPSLIGIGVQDYTVKGSDRFGRPYSDPEKAEDPVVSEIESLFEGKIEEKLRDVPKYITRDKKRIDLTEGQHSEWQKLTGEYFLEDLREALADPIWKELTTEEKIEEVRLIRKDAKADALADLGIEGDEEETKEE